MDIYLTVRTLHIMTSTILFGTGIGIAFFMYASHATQNLHEKYFAARMTVIPDYIFTAPAVILQPATGIWLILNGGYAAHDLWLFATYGLYIYWQAVAGCRLSGYKSSCDACWPLLSPQAAPCPRAIINFSVSGFGSAGRRLFP